MEYIENLMSTNGLWNIHTLKKAFTKLKGKVCDPIYLFNVLILFLLKDDTALKKSVQINGTKTCPFYIFSP